MKDHRDYEVPRSLQEWAELNEHYDTAEDHGDYAEMRRLDPLIEDAWFAAPMRDRVRLEWAMLKSAWRHRHDAVG